jgi:hypothetical protein
MDLKQVIGISGEAVVCFSGCVTDRMPLRFIFPEGCTMNQALDGMYKEAIASSTDEKVLDLLLWLSKESSLPYELEVLSSNWTSQSV